MQVSSALFALTALVSSASACYNLPDTDIPGWDVGNTRGDVNSCDSACKANNMCVTWAWSNYNGGSCWLKSRTPLFEGGPSFMPKPGVTATNCIFFNVQACGAYKDIDFVGNDITNVPSSDSGACCGQCKAFSACKAYTWSNYNGGTCWMKSLQGSRVYKTGVASGIV